jgi:hypothetical protein
LEGDYIHWGRFYRVGGWYTHILMWIAFVSWVITNALFVLDKTYAAIGTITTGTIMLLANIVFGGMSNMAQDPVRIQFRDGVIKLAYGWSFYLCLFTGIFCVVAGGLLLFFLKWPVTQRIFAESEDAHTTSLSKYFSSRNLGTHTRAAPEPDVIEMKDVDEKNEEEEEGMEDENKE